MSYDTALAIFSPDGRLIQVERAQHASEQGGVVVFTKTENEIFLSVERRNTSSMIIEDPLSKLFLIDPCTNIFMSFCGLSPDALCIRNKAQLICRQYKYDRGEDINIEQLAAGIAGEMQKNTISGGKRPYGVRTLIMGYYNGYRMYVVDPDGNYVEFKKGAIGMKSKEVMEFLVNSKGENECLEGICQVVNNDVGKICLFKIDRNGIERISDEVIKSFVDEFKSKNVQETGN